MPTGWDWFDQLTPDQQKALIGAGAYLGQGYFANREEDDREDQRRADSAIANKSSGINAVLGSEARDWEFGQSQADNRATNAARMSGNSPLEFQAQRARMSALGDVLGGAGKATFQGMPSRYTKHMPASMSTTPFSSTTMGFFDPGAMANSEQQYWAAQQNIDPRLKAPDLGSVGYGGAGSTVTNNLEAERAARMAQHAKDKEAYDLQAKTRRDALLASLDELNPNNQNGSTEGDEDDGGIDWKKWAGVGAGVGAGYWLGGRG